MLGWEGWNFTSHTNSKINWIVWLKTHKLRNGDHELAAGWAVRVLTGKRSWRMSHTRRVPSSAPVATMWGWVGWMARHWRADRSPVLTEKEDNYIYFRNKCIQLGFMLTVGKVWQANLTNDGRPTLWADQLSWRRPPHFASRKTQRSSCNCQPFLNETKYKTNTCI